MSDRNILSRLRGRLAGAALCGRLAGVVLCSALGAASAAHAGDISSGSGAWTDASTDLIEGTQESSISYSFSTSGPGTLHVQLSDDVWPSALGDLSFTALEGSSSLFTLDGSGSLSYDISGAGTYFGYVTGMATGALDLGLYSLKLSFDPAQPVPLPPSVWLLLAGLAAAAGMLRYRATLPQMIRRRAPRSGTAGVESAVHAAGAARAAGVVSAAREIGEVSALAH